MPAVATGQLVIELEGGRRILFDDPALVTLLAQLLVALSGHQEGGRS